MPTSLPTIDTSPDPDDFVDSEFPDEGDYIDSTLFDDPSSEWESEVDDDF